MINILVVERCSKNTFYPTFNNSQTKYKQKNNNSSL